MNIVNVIFYDSADYARLHSANDLPNVTGLTVKASGSNYRAGDGYIYWYNGKPAVNYKYFISSGHHTPSTAASGLSVVSGQP